MKIGIICATGKAGELILNEALARGHEVTAIVRNKSKLKTDKVKVIEKDAFSLTKADFIDLDVLVNAYGAPLDKDTESNHIKLGRLLINALAHTKTRLIVVGGAGSLFTDKLHQKRVVETLPEFVHPIANGQLKNLLDLESSSNLNWTFISPAMIFDYHGPKTGKYVIGKDELILNAKGESYVSYLDYAIALLDEIEHPKHLNQRFTVVAESK
ncbi:NAD(P)-dependent oxidoreductase [Acholeplasma hippikon]|uniref:NADH-flavin reductase n=1 Tax=Acholeplasma hippikon TaxID=264636 RepID=A0A449BIL3_9MOLU|nr:NAD(P)H-binding protein [Acholeplasma hippikon]VEU82243.1 Putative NADH-flavin reductase [Acholeplasma hippikon]